MIGFAVSILLVEDATMTAYRRRTYQKYFFPRTPVKRKLQSDLASYERRTKRCLTFKSDQPEKHGTATAKGTEFGVEQALPQADTFKDLPTLYSEELLAFLDYDRELENEKTSSVSCQSTMTAENISDLEKDKSRLMVENEKLLKEKAF